MDLSLCNSTIFLCITSPLLHSLYKSTKEEIKLCNRTVFLCILCDRSPLGDGPSISGG